MITSYHVHSNLSDGQNTIREFVHAAAEADIDEVGISDHYVLLPGGTTVDWSMPLDALPAYIDDIRAAADEIGDGVVVRYGLEADYDPDTADELRGILQDYPFDYVIGAVHFVDGFPVDECAENWNKLSQTERNDLIRSYWTRIEQMAASGLFDFAAHLDLYKKFGHLPTIDISADIAAALDALATAGMAAELNTAGWKKPIGELYPSPDIIRECKARGIPVLINADAHKMADLTLHYDHAEAILRDVGYTQKAVFQARQMTLVPL